MRRFTQLVVAVALVAGAATAGIARSAGAVPAAKIDRNATLSLTQTGPFSMMDPHRRVLSGDDPPLFMVYDRLFYIDHNVELQPMLATKWQFSPDGKTFTVTLRKDALFHDGSSVDATAIKKNVDRAKNLPTSTAKGNFSMIDSVDVVDQSTVRFNLNRQAADLPYALAVAWAGIVNPKVLDSGVDFRLGNKDAGSGAWYVASFKPNDEVVFERAPVKYWDPKAGLIKTVTAKYIPDYNTSFNALSSGQVDAGRTGDQMIAQAQGLAGHKFYAYPTTSIIAFMMRNTRPPFNNPDVRRAMSMLIDRDALGTLTQGGCEPIEQFYPPLSSAQVPGYKNPYPYNVKKAKALLQKAGVSNLEFSAVIGTTQPMTDIQVAIQAMFAKAGVKMNLTTEDSGPSVLSFRDGKYDAYVQTLTSFPDPYTMLNSYYFTPGGLYNLAGSEGADLKALAQPALDPNLSKKEQASLWRSVTEKMDEYMFAVPLCARKNFYVWPKDVKNYKTMSFVWASTWDIRYLARTGAR